MGAHSMNQSLDLGMMTNHRLPESIYKGHGLWVNLKKDREPIYKIARIFWNIGIIFQLKISWKWSMRPVDQWVHGAVHLAHTPLGPF
jgi:hypothetical protein